MVRRKRHGQNIDLTDKQVKLCERFDVEEKDFKSLLASLLSLKQTFERQEGGTYQRMQSMVEQRMVDLLRINTKTKPMKVYTVKVDWGVNVERSLRPTVTLIDGLNEFVVGTEYFLPYGKA